MAQRVMIVQVLVPKSDALEALSDERLDAVFDPVLSAAICEAGRRLP